MDDHTDLAHQAYLTTAEVAQLLRVTQETVRRMGRSGRLPGFVLSDKSGWRFRRADVDTLIKWASQGRQHAGDEEHCGTGPTSPTTQAADET